jgi:hypothetical protein
MIGKTLILLVCFFYSITALNSQGFSWKGDPRKPYQIPVLYLGGGLSFSQYASAYDFGLGVDGVVYDGNKLESAASVSVYGNAEYWIWADASIGGSLGIGFNGFGTTRSFAEPVSPTRDWQQRNDFDLSAISINLEGYIKKRVFGFFSVIGGIGLRSDISEESSHTLTSLDSELLFDENMESIDLPDTELDGYSGNTVTIFGGIGYDLAIIRGLYITPSVKFAINGDAGFDMPATFGYRFGLDVFYGID